MHHSVAIGDVDVKLVERIAAEVLEVLLHLHRDIVTRQILDQEVKIGPELARNRRKKDADSHSALAAILPQGSGKRLHSREGETDLPKGEVERLRHVVSND